LDDKPLVPAIDASNEGHLAAVYSAASQQWGHAEQVRWTLLYNFLMAATILLLAWAAVFSSEARSVARTIALEAMCIAGLLLSVSWLGLALRANGFVHHYAKFGRSLEAERLKVVGPFLSADDYRDSIIGLARLFPSRFILWLVPTLFGFVFLVASLVSLRP
jgi:hypothetical protein